MAKTDASALFDAVVDMPFTPEVLALLRAAERMRKEHAAAREGQNWIHLSATSIEAYDRAKRRLLDAK